MATVERWLMRDIIAGRERAAVVSTAGLVAEGASVGIDIVPASLDGRYEAWRAHRAVQGYLNGWRRAADLAAADGVSDVTGAAFAANGWRVDLTATTEVAEAYNTARDRALDETLWRSPAIAGQLFKVWDATLDKRTCGTCEHAHGTIVLADEDFPDGVPGRVHPRCRCIEHLLRRDEIDIADYAGNRAIS